MEKKRQNLIMQQEYESSQAEFQKVLKENEALTLLGRMVATLAHEIKTPIATISNLIQILPSRLSERKFTKRFIEITKEELNRTHQLIKNLLAYGKEIEVIKEEWIPLGSFIEALAAKENILAKVMGAAAIYGDRFYLELLFENLFRNSRVAGADEILIKFDSCRTNGDAFIRTSFEDNGRGFPQDVELDSLMNPFVTSNSSGAGLGLYLVKRIALAHQGEVFLYRTEKGAAVTIILPEKRFMIHEQF